MAKEHHALSIFGGDTTKGTGVSTEWDISLIDKSEHICEPERDRRIIYTVNLNGSEAEARIREVRNGEDVPFEDLDTVRKRKAYLKTVANVTEKLASQMVHLDLAISHGIEKINNF